MGKAAEKLRAWLNNPDISQDAWKTLTYKAIGEQVGISEYAVRLNLPSLVEEVRGISAVDCRKMRNEYAAQAKSTGRRIAPETWLAVEHARFHQKKSLHDISIEFGISYGTVAKHFQAFKKENF